MKGTILVVDDEPVIRDLTTRVLSHAGYDVVAASTFEEARQQADHENPDLLLVDVRLKEFNGLQLVLGERLKGRTCPVVVMSGYEDPVLEAEAARLGATYLHKPFAVRQLASTVEQLLAAARDPEDPPGGTEPGTA